MTTIEVGGSPQGVVVAHGRVWVTVDQQTIGNDPGWELRRDRCI